MANEFQGFDKIERFDQNITITEKIHGTNAQILIENDDDHGVSIVAGSRTRIITPTDDNFGFARWVDENKSALIEALGEGRHFGEWYGAGINAGYGLKEKRFALFNTHRWGPLKAEGKLPDRVDVVPVLYSGPFTPSVVEQTMQELRECGSALVPGYARPEGVVIRWDRSGTLMKKAFEDEGASWKREKAPKEPSVPDMLAAAYYQPGRLEKLLSRDERFARDYPASLPALCAAYVEDLVAESDLAQDEQVFKAVKRHLFSAVKGMMKEKGYGT